MRNCGDGRPRGLRVRRPWLEEARVALTFTNGRADRVSGPTYWRVAGSRPAALRIVSSKISSTGSRPTFLENSIA